MVGSHGSPWGYELLKVVLILAYLSFPLNSEAPRRMVAGMVVTMKISLGEKLHLPKRVLQHNRGTAQWQGQAPFLEQEFLPSHQALYLQSWTLGLTLKHTLVFFGTGWGGELGRRLRELSPTAWPPPGVAAGPAHVLSTHIPSPVKSLPHMSPKSVFGAIMIHCR